MPVDVMERFFEKTAFVDKWHDGTRCLEWTAAISPDGYGRFGYKGENWNAYKWLYEQCYDLVPKNRELDHLCRNRKCVAPLHLEVVTKRENVLRGVGPTAINARKTHCSNGHLLSDDNVWVRDGTGRCCKACIRKNCQTNKERYNANRRERYKQRRKS